VIEAFKLSTEAAAFLLQVFDYRGEISHSGILAGHGWRDTTFALNTPSFD
jgi:hypothetical protein